MHNRGGLGVKLMGLKNEEEKISGVGMISEVDGSEVEGTEATGRADGPADGTEADGSEGNGQPKDEQ